MRKNRRQAVAEIEITPEMIAVADKWLQDNRDALDAGDPSDLSDLVRHIIAEFRRHAVP